MWKCPLIGTDDGYDSLSLVLSLCVSLSLFTLTFHFVPYPSGGEVLSWGSNSHGQLGLGKQVSRSVHTPALVAALTGVAVTQISAGGSHTLFLTLPGLVYCCGANQSGQLGLNRVDEPGAESHWSLV